VPVRIARARRRHGDGRPHRIDERLGRGRPAAVVRDLEQVDAREAGAEQFGVDGLFHVTHQQEASRPDLTEQDHGHVVDSRPAVGWLAWDGSPTWPQRPEPDLVDGQPVAGGNGRPHGRATAR
jgi:hypothetical protein